MLRLASVEIVKDRAELDANVKHFFHKKMPDLGLVQMFIERFTFDEIHDEGPVPKLKKLIVNMGEAWMGKAR